MLSGPIIFLQKSYIVSRTKLTARLLEIKENNKIFLILFMFGSRTTTYKRPEKSGSELVMVEDIVEEAENIVVCSVRSKLVFTKV